MYTIVGVTGNKTKKYASFSEKGMAEKQLASALMYIEEYKKTRDQLELRVINLILGEENDLHHDLCSEYRIEHTH